MMYAIEHKGVDRYVIDLVSKGVPSIKFPHRLSFSKASPSKAPLEGELAGFVSLPLWSTYPLCLEEGSVGHVR